MLRLPRFTYHRPTSAAEAVKIAADHGPASQYVAGGTDLYPNMKRRVQTPTEVIALSGCADLVGVSGSAAEGITVGAMTTLTSLEKDPALQAAHPALVHAASVISTPLLRNMGTIGGNLLLDTRCNYYDQSHEWRESISFCMKCSGDTCWVAPSSPRCWAVQSSDTVPLLCAVGAWLGPLAPALVLGLGAVILLPLAIWCLLARGHPPQATLPFGPGLCLAAWLAMPIL